MKERSLSSGGIQMWPLLTMQPHISRVLRPRMRLETPFHPRTTSATVTPRLFPEFREATSEAAKQMTLETNERRRQRRRLSFVRAGTHGI